MNKEDRSSSNQEKLKKILSERLMAARLTKNVTISEMAEKTGLSRMSITRIEAGEQLPQLPALYEICLALDTTLTELLPSIEEIHPSARSIDGLSEEKLKKEIKKVLE
ncbi:MAG: helix-turn-helix domain-containing protein [Bacteriovoracia bacterium]